MKSSLKFISPFILLTALISNSFASDSNHSKKTNEKPHVHLDRSTENYFEQLSSNAFALQLLQVRNQFINQDLYFGGSLQGDIQHWEGDSIVTTPPSTYKNNNGIFFTQATFDSMININYWSTAFLSVADAHVGRDGPDGNDVFVPHAFVMFGNLDKTPIYLLGGINSIPFGVFTSSGPWDTPLTADYFNPTQATQINLGFFKNNFNAVAVAYNDATNHDKNFAYNLSYTKTNGNFNYELGAGYLTDLKTNSTGATPIQQHRKKQIAGIDMGHIWNVNASVGYKNITLYGEYLDGTNKVGINTSQPEALGFALTYTPTIYGKVTTFGIARSISLHLHDIPTTLSGYDAIPVVAAGLKEEWSLGVSRSVFRDYITLGADVERSLTYANDKTYTGTIDLMVYL